jgi:putative transposase
MISQGLQTSTLAKVVSRQEMSEGDLQRAIAELQDFIALRPNAREVRKALAVKLVYQGLLV